MHEAAGKVNHPTGAGSENGFRLGFDSRMWLEFDSSKISSDGGFLLFRELNETLGLHNMVGRSLRDARTGKNGVHNFFGLLRQSIFGRLAQYPVVNNVDQLSRDPVMRQHCWWPCGRWTSGLEQPDGAVRGRYSVLGSQTCRFGRSSRALD
jgi:hypothetical protein